MNAITGSTLSDVGVVVVRYYGGVKLGTGGLARAYRDAAQAVLTEVKRETRYVYDEVRVEAPFSRINVLYRLVDPPGVLLSGEEFGERNVFTFRVRRSEADAFRENMRKQQFVIEE